MFEKGHTLSKKPIEYYVTANGCWIELNHKGIYPTMGNLKGQAQPLRIYEYMYKTYKGNIPRGYRLYHSCKNKKCINPDHLIPIKIGKSRVDNKVRVWPGGRGEDNSSWNGGIAEYPNHSLMKRNRIIKLQQTHGLCEICGAHANRIHHIDGSKNNHDLSNLIALCNKCHHTLHANRENTTSKYRNLYGKTLHEMEKEYGVSIYFIQKMHDRGELKDFVLQHDKMVQEPVGK